MDGRWGREDETITALLETIRSGAMFRKGGKKFQLPRQK